MATAAVSNSELRLSEFDISEKTGFVPSTAPVTRLRDSCFAPWEDLARKIPTLVKEKRLRDQVHKLPEVDFNDFTLGSEEEWRKAYILLTFISQAYLWERGEEGLPDKVPKILAVPWTRVSEHIGIPPVATYSSMVLYNWRLRDQSRPWPVKDLDNLTAIHSFSGTDDESWFYMVHIDVELAGVPGINAIMNAYRNMTRHNNQELTENLVVVTESLKQMKLSMKRMYEHCNQEVFYLIVRPFLAGSKGLAAFPNGLVYEGVSSIPKQFAGASGAQTALVPTFDIFLGAKHSGSDAEFLEQTRKHLPPKHRKFLEELSKQPSVRDYVAQSQDRELTQAYNNAVEAFKDFRTDHIILATSYIVNQKAKSVNVSLDSTGTGGTNFVTFLKKVRDDTKALLIDI